MSHLKLVTGNISPHTAVYVEALEHLDIGMCIVDEEGAVLAGNQQFRRLLDLPADWPSLRDSGKTHSATEELVTGWVARVEAQGDFRESVALSDDVTLLVAGKALPSGGISLTLTEAAAGEYSELAEDVARFRALLAHMPSTLSLKGADGRFLIVNDAWERDLKIPTAQMLGKTIWEVFPEDDWSDSDAGDRLLLSGERDVIEDEVVVNIAGRGRRTLRRTKFPVLDGRGRPAGIGTINTDVTEQIKAQEDLRRSEIGLRHAQQLAKIGHWEKNFVTGEIFWSDQVFQILGFETQKVPNFDQVLRQVHPDDRQKVREKLDSVFSGVAQNDIEFRIVLPSGEIRYVQEMSEVELDSDAKAVRCVGIIQDVTEAKLAEQALRRSEAVLKNAQQLARMGSVERNFANGEAYWSDSVYDIFGMEKRPTVPDFVEIMDHLHPDDVSVYDDMLSAMFAGEAKQEVDFRVVMPSGDIRYVHELLEAEFDDAGNTTRCIAVIQDITDRKLAEIALRESEQRFRSLIDNLPSAVSLKDRDHRFVLVNKGFEEYFDRPAESVIGQPVLSAMPDYEGWESVIAADQEILDGRHGTLHQTITLRFDYGIERTFELRKFSVADAAGRITGVGTISTDITDRLRAEGQRRDSEASLEQAQRIAQLGSWVWDAARDELSWSQGLLRLLQLDEVENATAHRHFRAMVHPDDRDKILPYTDLPNYGETGESGDYRITLGDASEHIFRTLWQVERDAAGAVARVVGVTQDVTELRQSEAALRKSEASLANAQRIARLGNWDWDIANNGLYWSDEIYEIFGLQPREFDETYEAFVNTIHPDDRGLVQQAVDAALSEGKDYSIDHRIVLPDGEIRIVHEEGEVVYDEAGRPVHMNGTVQDVTEQRQAEQTLRESEARFRALVDNLPAGVILKSADGKVIFINGRIEEWYGVPLGRIAGRRFHDVTKHSKENIAVHEQMLNAQRTVLEAGKTVDIEYLMKFADDTEHDLRAIIFPVASHEAGKNDIGIITLDITGYKKTEALLRQAQKMEVVGQLTGGVAHDFNNLLAVVIGNLEMAADELGSGAPGLDFIRNAFTAAERGASLTHHLLAFSRQQVLQPEETDIGELIADTKDLMAVSMGERIAMGVQTDEHLWHCKVDPVQLQNAILNLSINARDAMPSGGKVTISAANMIVDEARAKVLDVAAGKYVCLSVRDTGPGIPQDVLEHVYEPFFTTKALGEGSGLGLSMVYGFVRQSGGAVEIDTAEGEGTTVCLYFPVVHSDAAGGAEADAVERGGDLAEPAATVLLVEDNAAFRDITSTILHSLNFRTIEAGTAEEALAVIGSAARFDLLLSDIGLPGDMNGHDLAAFAASARPGLKIVLMSAHTDPGAIGGVIDGNVSAFLRKPHRKEGLNNTLRRILDLDT